MKITLQAMLNTLADVGRTQALGRSDNWRSDGSPHPSKNCVGKLYKIGRSKTGMKMYIRKDDGSEKVINYRMPQDVVTGVLSYVYNNNPRYQGAHHA